MFFNTSWKPRSINFCSFFWWLQLNFSLFTSVKILLLINIAIRSSDSFWKNDYYSIIIISPQSFISKLCQSVHLEIKVATSIRTFLLMSTCILFMPKLIFLHLRPFGRQNSCSLVYKTKLNRNLLPNRQIVFIVWLAFSVEK